MVYHNSHVYLILLNRPSREIRDLQVPDWPHVFLWNERHDHLNTITVKNISDKHQHSILSFLFSPFLRLFFKFSLFVFLYRLLRLIIVLSVHLFSFSTVLFISICLSFFLSAPLEMFFLRFCLQMTCQVAIVTRLMEYIPHTSLINLVIIVCNGKRMMASKKMRTRSTVQQLHQLII